ncbi:response regulator [Sphingomonas glaciei]|uniref:histidine kinase n=1 Tax=Sphingomonas glaciei TaxID=2938948 RepID=A0ABY5MXM9_9SPHN|nr:response regulator [Sphingomonas glaciei]UUR07878.1 response regulator [Sphingomonas glaciei]
MKKNEEGASAARSNLSTLVGVIAALAFFLVTGAVTYLNIQAVRAETDRVTSTHEVITSLGDLLSAMQDAETGQRGFLLTGENSFLQPYRDAEARSADSLQTLDRLTRDEPEQQANLRSLRPQVAAKFAGLARSIAVRQREGLASTLATIDSDRDKAEMDAVRAKISQLRAEERQTRMTVLARRDAAFRTATFSAILATLLGIGLTLAIGALTHRTMVARRRQAWLQSGVVGLSKVMLGDKTVRELSGDIVDYLTAYTGAQACVLFKGEHGVFERMAMLGVPSEAKVTERFALREGLLGRVAAEDAPMVIDDIPEGYLAIGSALGSDMPRHLVIAPLRADGIVNAVVEFGFLKEIDSQTLELLAQVAQPAGTALRSAKYRTELQTLLEESQRQSEELQVQSEELKVSNEELEEQGRALKESAVRLEQQQVELEQTNSQLEEQAQLLEAQRDDIARSSAAVELKARELERASQYKSDFLANMSHELRTPLNSLLILSKLLGDNPNGNLTDEQAQYARTIQASGNDLLNLINDILDLSKIEAGHVEIRPEDVAVSRLVKDLQRTFDPIASERRLAFEIDIAKDVPASIVSDRQRLEQILKNLLANAFKFTEQGKVTLAIAKSGSDRVALTVTDTGIGIAPEQQQAIFEAFRQADGAINRKFGGTGLGLSISRELARLLGGAIALKSEPGTGSSFTVTIPAEYDPALVPGRPQPAPAATPSDAPLSPPKPAAPRRRAVRAAPLDDDRDHLASGSGNRVLLIVEDDRTFAGIVRDIAREASFQTLVAGTAEEALELAREHKPSGIVLDLGLPDQSGLAVLDRLKREDATRHIPIHVISASDQTQTAFSLGAMGYLVKPVRREELTHALEALEAQLTRTVRRVLIVEDDDLQRDAVGKLLAGPEIETVGVGTAAECLKLLSEQTFDCMVLDLSLPDASGYSLLETLSKDGEHSFPPVIVYTGRDLSQEDEQRLRRYSSSIIIKGAKSPERLLDEVTLFLHQVVSELPPEQQKMIQQARHRDALLEGKTILVVEDDVRNVYSLTNILEPRGAKVTIARNGQEALDALGGAGGDGIDLVLMDVMMPVMDGLEATRKIRADQRWGKLPIIMLTAKAMPDDQQKCLAAGASDYMAKPLDVDKLLSLVRVWMPR